MLLFKFLFLSLCATALASYEKLTVRPCGKLPSPRHNHAAAYDGQDSIYVLGGTRKTGDSHSASDHIADVVRYSLTTGESSVVASFGSPVAYGSAVYTNGMVYYFGPTVEQDGEVGAVWKLSASNPVPVKVTDLDKTYSFSAVTSDDKGSVYLIGGTDEGSSAVDQYNIITSDVKTVANLPRPISFSSAVYSQSNIWLFGGGFPDPDDSGTFYVINDAFQIEVKSSGEHVVAEETITLPTNVAHSSSVIVQNDLVYIVGGYWISDAGVLRFNITEKLADRETLDKPWEVPYRHASVYVEKYGKKVIYTFGGLDGDGNETDEIVCLDLNTNENDGSGAAMLAFPVSLLLLILFNCNNVT